jgi:hypothetical protein
MDPCVHVNGEYSTLRHSLLVGYSCGRSGFEAAQDVEVVRSRSARFPEMQSSIRYSIFWKMELL